MFAGSLFLAWLILVNYANVMAPGGIGSIPLLGSSIFGGFVVGGLVVFEVAKMRPLMVTVRPDRIRLTIKRGKHKEIVWGPKVHVDVELDDRFSKTQYGPLAGIGVYIPNEIGITVYAEDGWNIEDVRKMLRPIMGLIKEKGLTMDEEMLEYIKYQRDRTSTT